MNGFPERKVRVERYTVAPWPPEAMASAAADETAFPLGLLLLALLAVGGAVRWWLLWRAYLIPDADQTIISLMARHVLAGEHPVFYWGQPYTGSGDAYILAGLFALFGEHDILPHLAPLAASLIWAALTVTLGWRLYGRGVAILCAAILAFPTNLLVDWGIWAGSGYLEMMALGTAALLLALPRGAERAPPGFGRLWLAFFLLGVALWVQPLAMAYLVAVLTLLWGRLWTALHEPARWPGTLARVIGCGCALAAGAAPLLVFNARHDWATLAYLTQRGAHLAIGTVIGRALLWTGPVLLGLAPATTSQPTFTHFLDTHLIVHGFALLLVGFLLGRGLLQWRAALGRLRELGSARPSGDLALLVLLIVMCAGFLTSSWGAEQWSATQPRYLLPIYTALPLIVRAALPRRIAPAHWGAAGLVVAALGAGSLWVNGAANGRPDFHPLAALLEQQGIGAVYGDYWTVVPITYLSDERVVGVAVRDDLGNLHNNRYSPYLRTAAATRRYGWVVQAGSARQRALLACFRQLGAHYAVTHWEDEVIYTRITGWAYPWWNGGKCPLEPALIGENG